VPYYQNYTLMTIVSGTRMGGVPALLAVHFKHCT